MKNQLVTLELNVGTSPDNEVILPEDLLEVIGSMDLNLTDAKVTGYHLKDVDSGIESDVVLFNEDGKPYTPSQVCQ